MANRNFPALCLADNSAGSLPVALNVWRHGVRRFHVGTGHPEPTHDAGYTTAGFFPLPSTPVSFLLCLRGSPYTKVSVAVEHELVSSGEFLIRWAAPDASLY